MLDALAHAELVVQIPDTVLPCETRPGFAVLVGEGADCPIAHGVPECHDGLTDEWHGRIRVQVPVLAKAVFDELVHGPARALGQFIAWLEDQIHFEVSFEDQKLQRRVARLSEAGVLDGCSAEERLEHGLEVGVEDERRTLLQHGAVQEEECHLVLARLDGKLVLLSVLGHHDDLDHQLIDLGFGVDEEEVAEGGRAVFELAVELRNDGESVVHEEPRGAGCGGTEDCCGVQQMVLLWRDFLRKSRQKGLLFSICYTG